MYKQSNQGINFKIVNPGPLMIFFILLKLLMSDAIVERFNMLINDPTIIPAYVVKIALSLSRVKRPDSQNFLYHISPTVTDFDSIMEWLSDTQQKFLN